MERGCFSFPLALENNQHPGRKTASDYPSATADPPTQTLSLLGGFPWAGHKGECVLRSREPHFWAFRWTLDKTLNNFTINFAPTGGLDKITMYGAGRSPS